MGSPVGIASSNGLKFYAEKRHCRAVGSPVVLGSGASERASRPELKIAWCVPRGGVTGIWGPSALASAKPAAAELNNWSGIGGEIPFVYTLLYEGGECTPGVLAVGNTPARPLRPTIAGLAKHGRPRRRAFLGNDYGWPHASHRLARNDVARRGADAVPEAYVPPHAIDFSEPLATIRCAGVDAVLLSPRGEDAIAFSRAFGEQGFGRSALRLSCVIDENELLAIGARNTERLDVASRCFEALATDANIAFKERHDNHFGDRSSTLNSLGQSIPAVPARPMTTVTAPTLRRPSGRWPKAMPSG